MKHWYIRPAAEPRTHNATPARTAMIQSIHGQACARSDRMERVLLAIFDVLTDEQQDRALRLLGWEATSRDGAPGVAAARASSANRASCPVHGGDYHWTLDCPSCEKDARERGLSMDEYARRVFPTLPRPSGVDLPDGAKHG